MRPHGVQALANQDQEARFARQGPGHLNAARVDQVCSATHCWRASLSRQRAGQKRVGTQPGLRQSSL